MLSKDYGKFIIIVFVYKHKASYMATHDEFNFFLVLY